MFRQGDLLFVPTPGAEGDVVKGARAGILARGEATGHAHRLESLDGVDVYVAEGGELIVGVAESVNVVHEEHDTVTLSPGYWRVRRQREYDPDAVARERMVAD